jgi:transposase
MAKTRSQTGNIVIKKEQEEDVKPNLGLGSVLNTTRSKMTKRKPTIHKNDLPAQQVKVEEDTDTKSLLQSTPSSSKGGSRPRISQEQINQLIHYIVNDNMNITKASRKIKLSKSTGFYYYNLYKTDPEKKIPAPQIQTPKIYTQEQIGNLIRYIDTDKITVKEASAKTNMPYRSASYYYNKYLEDPNHAIPVQQLKQSYTQEQKSKFINYIVIDKMSTRAASKKAKMNLYTARNYYNYFKVQNPDVATPSHIIIPKRYTQEQIQELIDYIVDDKMTIKAASRKAKFCEQSAGKYYRQYLKDNMEIPVPKNNKCCAQDQIDALMRYIVDNKMSILAASKKANMSYFTSYKYYRQYLNQRKH